MISHLPFRLDNVLSNSELSSGWANSRRPVLRYFKDLEDCFSSIFGRAGTETLIPYYPINARNRRLSISLLRGMGEVNSMWYANLERDEALPSLGVIRES